MPDTREAAHILFPTDAPPVRQPSGLDAQLGSRVSDYAMNSQGNAAAPTLKSDTPKPPDTTLPARDAAKEPAHAMFSTDAVTFDDKPIASFFDGFALSAINGDMDRAHAINTARDAIIADAKAAGTDSAALADALGIVREGMGSLHPPTPEQSEAAYSAGIATLQSELGSTFNSDIEAARALIRDLEKIAPGTMDTLERSGSGNDPRIIRAAIKEARRRGYR